MLPVGLIILVRLPVCTEVMQFFFRVPTGIVPLGNFFDNVCTTTVIYRHTLVQWGYKASGVVRIVIFIIHPTVVPLHSWNYFHNHLLRFDLKIYFHSFQAGTEHVTNISMLKVFNLYCSYTKGCWNFEPQIKIINGDKRAVRRSPVVSESPCGCGLNFNYV
jgi:hypothetical protein